ncbi:MAG TPA: hypothetical protein VKC34_17800 [Blastocatellia bacterium]|nr:hypothetical protein [Blastocatellia bacterium]
MMNAQEPEYILTIIQHTYCNDCMWMKGKITDAYHASGIVRGEDSKRWRMQIISPPWERDDRRAEFPRGFNDVDVPAMKLEVGRRLAFATQNPALINELLMKLKWMLINRHSNAQIEKQLLEIARDWKDSADSVASCPIDVTASARP